MQVGVIKWFNHAKGYGFIEPSDGSKDVFVHISTLSAAGIRDIREHQAVSFQTKEYKDKISAINIELIPY